MVVAALITGSAGMPALDGWRSPVGAVVALVGPVLAERGARRRRERTS